ncbi:alpha/beta fold hydrolase [Corynebacterium epidermidicanis]|uniref:Putative hydrolase or acyltransferase of alpha/beta superfamily n=1 Tax=Corynebacterium epidermidicanis TaxID=1050174 RepID=A0A0G3GR28_9CORY|nr:alpha/beta hydrolase [Corynebacterium epidermidicanis]AKK03611.1 putative hydrolase or acyltransferase of alpha/beta superfamily [Corynebacterium epidermidicanis]
MDFSPLFNRLARLTNPPTKQVPGLGNLCTIGHIDGPAGPITTYTLGPDDAETTVVFIHGFTLAADSFFQQARFLRDNYPRVRCLMLDLRGHGRTGEYDPELLTVDGAADDVRAAIDALAPAGPLIVVGHSLGGLIALSLLRRAPEAVYRRIRGLMLIATSIESLSAQGLPQVLAMPIADRAYRILESSPERIDKFREEMADLLAPALAATVFKRHSTPYDLVKFHADMIHKTPLSTFAGYFHDLQEHDEVAAADRLAGLPGFVIVGRDDHVTPLSQSKHIVDRWPDATLIETKGVGHMIILEAPEVVNGALAELLSRC